MKKNQISQPLQLKVTSSETPPRKESLLWQELTELEQEKINGGGRRSRSVWKFPGW